jgi:NAD(P)-dependent dehydrogenase (short-subunit alcohol dehydrogenase family)
MDLSGRAALVTGGASGIGAAVAALLKEAGARVAVLDLHDADLVCDVGDEKQMVDAVRQVVDSFGGLDIAVLAAGVGSFAAIRDLTTEEWDRVHRVNLRGAFVGLRECAKVMGDGGVIVAITSVSSFLADRGMAAYSTSKAALSQLVRVAARELGRDGIRVNAVAPGTTDTPLGRGAFIHLPGYAERAVARTALGRLGAAVDIADAVIALIGLDWVTGQVLVADGGQSLYSPIDPMESLEDDP